MAAAEAPKPLLQQDPCMFAPYDKVGDGPASPRGRGIGGNLQRMRRSEAYTSRLSQRWMRFSAWCAGNRKATLKTLRVNRVASRCLILYFQMLFETQPKKVSTGRLTVLAVQWKFPRMKGRLAGPWDSIHAWQQVFSVSCVSRYPRSW